MISYRDEGGGVVSLTIERPEQRNALDTDHFRLLADCWQRFGEDSEARVAVISGAGRDFCAGADLADSEALRAHSYAPHEDSFIDRALLRGTAMFKPIVAAVTGVCFGAGMDLLGGCDLRVAADDAQFGSLEPRFGLMASGGTTSRLPRQLPWPAAMEILLTAEPLPAQRALALGLVNRLVPTTEVVEAALGWAKRIARNSPAAIQGTKRSALGSLTVGSLAEAYALEDQIAAEVNNGAEAIEGIAAFVEKRPPKWTTP